MPGPFTQEQLSSLSARIDQQLQQLRDDPPASFRKGNGPDKQDKPEHLPVQWRAIAEQSGEAPRSFWQRFKRAAHNDLCQEGGVLHGQWKKWGDLRKESVLKSFGAILVAMGFSGNALQVLVVALAVIVLHIGCTAVCDEEGPSTLTGSK